MVSRMPRIGENANLKYAPIAKRPGPPMTKGSSRGISKMADLTISDMKIVARPSTQNQVSVPPSWVRSICFPIANNSKWVAEVQNVVP